MLLKITTVLALGLSALAAPALAQSQCTPLPAKCSTMNDQAIRYMNRIQGGIVGTHGAMSVAYCANKATAEVVRVCAAEYRAAGNTTCADLSEQQRQQSEATARQADAAASATYAGSGDEWKAACGF